MKAQKATLGRPCKNKATWPRLMGKNKKKFEEFWNEKFKEEISADLREDTLKKCKIRRTHTTKRAGAV